jgi:hypothetical protein
MYLLNFVLFLQKCVYVRLQVSEENRFFNYKPMYFSIDLDANFIIITTTLLL